MEEDINTTVAVDGSGLVTDEGAVVQIIMRGEDGDTLIPNHQLIQINTDEGQMQYLEVTDKYGETQYIQVTADGQAQLIQFTDAEQDNAAMTTDMTNESLTMVEAQQPIEDMPVAQLPVKEEETNLVPVFNSVADNSLKQELPENVELHENNQSLEEMPPEKKMKTEDVLLEDEHKVVQVVPSSGDLDVNSTNQTEVQQDHQAVCTAIKAETEETKQDTAITETSTDTKTETPTPKTQCPIPDLSSPIELESETVVTINSKKCVLKVDPETGKLRAYPLKPPAPATGKRPRGRPRKIHSADDKKLQSSSKIVEKPSAAPTEQENSAAEGLLGLSESDGRRKSLRVKKKPHVLAEYEIGAIEGVEDPDEDDGAKLPPDDKDVVISSVHMPSASAPGEKRGRGRPAKTPTTTNQLQNFLANLGLPVKRGRGRPRRYPPPGSANQVPTFIIPQPSGQAVVMKPVQGLAVKPQPGQVTILPAVRQEKPAGLTTSPQKFPPIVIQNADGTQTHIVASVPNDNNATVSSVTSSQNSTTDTTPVTVIMTTPSQGDQLGGDIKEEQVEDTVVSGGEASLNTDQELSNAGSSSAVTGVTPVQNDEQAETDKGNFTILQQGVPSDGVEDTNSQPLSATITLPGEEGTAAVIEVPQNLVPLLMSGKSEEPIKIGLKQTESDLEKLKCEKCNFQSYYLQQYQEHLSIVHEGEIFKCKCCNFSSFDEEGLNEHYKTMHPKNVCAVCNFRAEHAYIVKRHMMRHNSKGCKCQLCGKTYKDRYILKMHIKMVHMPAEVLFECSVCSKKFTRKAHLKRHTRIHDPEKPFKCPFCEYRGCERSDVTKHVVIHNEPKYACEVCGKFFRHMKNKELHLKRHKGQRDYKCGVCDFYGYTFTDIRKHIDRKHADAKIVCGKCGSVFRTEHQLEEHAKTCVSNLITIKPGDFSVLGEVTDDKGSISQMSATHITSDNSIYMEGNNHDYIRVEQVSMDLEDEESVSLSRAQISETSMAEPQLVEQHMSTGQTIHSVDPVILTGGNEIIQLSADIDQNIIEGATHIQISETGELIKIGGELAEGAVIHEGVLPPGVALIEADQYDGGVESSQLHEDGSQMSQAVELDENGALAISQSQELTGHVELVGSQEEPASKLHDKAELREEHLVDGVQVRQDGVLINGTEVQTGEVLTDNSTLPQCSETTQ